MSIKLMAMAFDARVSNPLRKLVLLKLCDHANEKGQCWPSFNYIADQCEISRRSAITHIQALIEDGYLTSESRFKDGEQTTNMYTVSHSRLIKSMENAALGGESTAPRPVQEIPVSGESTAPRTTTEPPKGNTIESSLPKNKFSDDDFKCAEWLAAKLKEFIPDCKSPDLNGWAGHVRKMRELDNRDLREICELWTWCRKDSFEAANVQSPEKLRKRYDQLKTKMRKPHEPANGKPTSLIDRFIDRHYPGGLHVENRGGDVGRDDGFVWEQVEQPIR